MDLTEIRVFEEQKIGTLLLSEAIRIGARLRPQSKGCYCAEGRTCAIGAAAEAMYGGDENTINVMSATIVYKLIRFQSGLSSEIFSRNDRGDTREQIADWLEAQGL